MTRSLLSASVLVGVMSVYAACSCGAPTSTDAGLDSPEDLALDTPRDVWRPFDGPPQDDGPDLFDGGPTDPGWQPMPGLHPSCLIERAEHPERVLDIEWLSCGEGCEYLAPDERYQRAIDPFGAFHDGDRGYFTVVQGAWSQVEDSRQRMVVLADTRGEVYGAWREPRRGRGTGNGLCYVAGSSFGPGLAQVTIAISNRADRAREVSFFLAPLNEIGAMTEPTVVFDDATIPLGAVLQRPKISSTLYAAELQPAGDLMLIRPDGTWERQHVEGIVQKPKIVGEDVFFDEHIGGYRRLVHARFGQPQNVVLQQEGAHIAGATVTSEWITWQLAPSPGSITLAERIDLYVSPFATTTEALEPRLLMNFVPELVDGFAPQYGEDGWVVTRFPSRFIRIEDGAAFKWPNRDGRVDGGQVAGNDGYLWINNGEVATASVFLGDQNSGTVIRSLLTMLEPL